MACPRLFTNLGPPVQIGRLLQIRPKRKLRLVSSAAMTDRPIRGRKLAAKLAEGLAAVVPAELEVSVAGAIISLRDRATGSATIADLEEDLSAQPDIEDVSTVIRSALIVMDSDLWRATRSAPPRAPFIEIDDISWTLEPLLDQFQDEVAETLAEPWPAVAPDPMPQPFVELQDGRVVAGYGDPADPALTVLSVTLQDLR
jgi:hypothetical protein